MKWTPIDRAKPKFKQLYLLFLDGYSLGLLKSQTTTSEGLEYSFVDTEGAPVENVTHIAAVNNPE
jgi:hypothetical protein